MALILVVDDSDIIRMMLREFLEAEGHQVLEAADGLQGVAQAGQQTVDLAIVDIFMPGKEGLSTIKELKAARPQLPVVAISAGSTFTDTETLDWAKDYGADRTMPKPLDRQIVIATVRELLAAR
ncbi:response regulator transcription factor [Megalodesulfovibrio gigas]|uniref:Putative response regulator with CheY-like receiver, AAA-type ATPase, and DNA-binding domains n=1 Tax=Megalodesulfovibrio gigas (strain ATCC 19364 / DSM 1382 / NCIMB 9332 / VKM B-1759) TaxID=1121448 RepID=T2GFP4_MEGG1|nr:response regulator [Megalodesulfovibrio gigas]AGW15103.1 putative response regulator with CheY-like receiver, AAA-type ATPase, and DNA-binding domains [Megalodesulfovibrio gigas DSM 1382 = ATCC 19364]